MTTTAPDAPFALARYREEGRVRLGLAAGERIRPLSSEDLGADGLNAFLAAPDWDRLQALADADGPWVSLADVTLTAPVEPRQVLQTGANYREHVIELDWELELALVIGREAFQVPREDAWEHIAGYTIVNDVTTRDLVFRKDMKEIGTDWYRAKNAPGFLPTGPFLVPAPFVSAEEAAVRLDLNGQTMQDASTSDLLFDIPALLSAASQTHPLYPGDLLLTGSPAGNGQHWRRFLRDGDVMTGTIANLGTQVVRCVSPASDGASS